MPHTKNNLQFFYGQNKMTRAVSSPVYASRLQIQDEAETNSAKSRLTWIRLTRAELTKLQIQVLALYRSV